MSEALAARGVVVSYETVRAWAKRAGVEQPSPVAPALRQRLEARRAAAAAAESAPEAELDFDGELRGMIAEARQEAREHAQASNPRAAQAALTRATKLMAMLAQSEKRKPANPDVLTFSKAEIDAEFARVSALLAKLCERPVLCSECSRSLSVKFGRGLA
ncbi:MAG TPA: hypothetical protein VHB79_10790 [Polyangiaceae bacterium]|nr:hypothetical protein [Polyangiaceae bacterium]